jgi:hypothetical protein
MQDGHLVWTVVASEVLDMGLQMNLTALSCYL